MNDFAVIGAGHIGSEIAGYLSRRGTCVLVDPNRESLDRSSANEKFVGTLETNPEILSKSDVFVVALPGSVAKESVKILLKNGKKVIDVSFYEEDPFYFAQFVDGNALYVPDCGFAPGLSNIITGHLVKNTGADNVEIYVAGLPQEPLEPFRHSITWSVEGLVDEYLRPAKIIRDGKVQEIDPLSITVKYAVNGLAELEGFYTDGLRTLLRTMEINNLKEITLRYSGHLDRMKFLRDMGFFSGEGTCNPRGVSQSVFSRFADSRDLCILDVLSTGRGKHKIELRSNGTESLSSMALLTGHTAAIVAVKVSEDLEAKGFTPPEELAVDTGILSYIFNELRKDGVRIAMS